MRRLERKIVMYLSSELLVAIVAILGNGMVAVIYLRERRLRTPTNLYIFSLAIVNLLTSFIAIPMYLNTLINPHQHDFDTCLLVNAVLVTFCTISILHLVALSFDRYIAIVWNWKPASHIRGMLHASAFTLMAWLFGGLVGCLPLIGWHNSAATRRGLTRCEFLRVMDSSYLLFIFYATVVTPSVLLIFFYINIYRRTRSHDFGRTEQLASVQGALDTRMSVRKRPSIPNNDANNQLQEIERTVQEQQLRHQINRLKRVTFSVLLVIICFHICWYPLHIMNVIAHYSPPKTFRKWHFYAPIVLSHASNAINPLIYGLTMPKFKDAFIDALICKHGAAKGRRRDKVSLRGYH